MNWPFRRRPGGLPAAIQGYLDAPAEGRQLRWRAARYAVLDLEMSGLDPRRDAILAIGLAPISEGRIDLGGSWYTAVQPPDGTRVDASAIRVHGILGRDLADAPSESAAMAELLSRLTGHVLVVHVAGLDVAFLNRALRRCYGIALRGPGLDTARLAMKLAADQRFLGGGADPEQPLIQLRSLAERAGLPVFPEHDALNDALTTAQLFLHQATTLEQQGGATLGALLRAGGCLR
jgi:DNA polymerase III subunit epsilon